VGGEWYYEEYARGGGVSNLGGNAAPESGSAAPTPGAPRAPEDKSLMNSDGLPPNRGPAAPSEERKSILDLFRN
jgi:penicillin-binding protein 1A